MWIIFGFIAIGLTLINLYMYKTGKNYSLAMAGALSFTSLTLCAEYNLINMWVRASDWSGLMDVVPTMTVALWILTIISILINITPALLDLKKNRSKR